jgi:4-hydroxy-tetrahydrodipicolinate synthase
VIERLLKAYPGTVVGMKDSSGDWGYQESVLTGFPGFDVFTGSERYCSPTCGWAASARSAPWPTSSPARFALYDNYLAENAAPCRRIWTAPATATRDYAAIPALKEIMATRTGDANWRNLRPPLVNLTAAQVTELLARARAGGWSDR